MNRRVMHTFEEDFIITLPHPKYSLSMPLAVSALLHGALVAALLFNAARPGVREEVVKVFVVGEAASSLPGVGGESGPPGSSPAAGSRQSIPRTAASTQLTAAQKPRKLPARNISSFPVPQEEDMATGTVEPARTPPSEQINLPNLPEGSIVASVGGGGSGYSPGGDHNATGRGTGNGSGKGSAGFGSGAGGGGNGSGGAVTTRFGSADAPLFKYREVPRYPAAARRRGEEGKVLLRLTIDERGKLVQVEVVESSGTDFAEAAVEAVKRSRFLPAQRNNTPIMSMALLPIRFELKP